VYVVVCDIFNTNLLQSELREKISTNSIDSGGTKYREIVVSDLFKIKAINSALNAFPSQQ